MSALGLARPQMLDRLSPAMSRRLGLAAGPTLVMAVQVLVFPMPLGAMVDALVLGVITAMIAVGLVLVYRANRVINFAAADLGYVPAVLVTMLILASGLNYFLALFLGLAAALVLGVAIEFLIIRRFFNSSRLILTVATVGLSQVLSFAGVILPRRWNRRITAERIDGPLDITWDVGTFRFNGDHALVLIFGPLAILAVGLIVRYTSIGIAIRASAERADRAALLGIPVKRLQTVVWTMATVLAFLAVFFTSTTTGLPIGGALGFAVVLRSFAALIMARMTSIPVAVAGSLAMAMLQQGVNWNAESPTAGVAVVAAVIIAMLLVLRPGNTRAERDNTASWQASDDAREIPPELLALPQVRYARWTLFGLGAAVLIGLPHFLGTANSLKASATLVFTLVVLSLVVLTGWAGQVSLGQTGFMAIGAVVGARLTNEWGFDLALALPVAGLAGLVAALIIGVPALRMPGLYLSVTTLAFSTALASYLLNPLFANDAPGWLQAVSFNWIPDGRVERLPLLGRISWDSPTSLYYVVLVSVAVIFIAVRGVRRSRTGRVLIAMRENPEATQSYGVSATRAKLTAFGLSGFIAGWSGALFVHHQQAYDVAGYGPGLSLGVFTAAVVGGVGSLFGAFLGGLYWTGGYLFLEGSWRLIATGAGVLMILLTLPSGLAGGVQRLRDLALRTLADRMEVLVPSLVADKAGEDDDVVAAVSAADRNGVSAETPNGSAPEEPEDADSPASDSDTADSLEVTS